MRQLEKEEKQIGISELTLTNKDNAANYLSQHSSGANLQAAQAQQGLLEQLNDRLSKNPYYANQPQAKKDLEAIKTVLANELGVKPEKLELHLVRRVSHKEGAQYYLVGFLNDEKHSQGFLINPDGTLSLSCDTAKLRSFITTRKEDPSKAETLWNEAFFRHPGSSPQAISREEFKQKTEFWQGVEKTGHLPAFFTREGLIVAIKPQDKKKFEEFLKTGNNPPKDIYLVERKGQELVFNKIDSATFETNNKGQLVLKIKASQKSIEVTLEDLIGRGALARLKESFKESIKSGFPTDSELAKHLNEMAQKLEEIFSNNSEQPQVSENKRFKNKDEK
ncbi:MAG: hypothetical protein NZT61_07435 [Deltaproteobacteria bacterium]|nr:hypothetical protein [Deltaproteobacteria bacterium]